MKEKIDVTIVVKYEGPNGEARAMFKNIDDAILFANVQKDRYIGMEREYKRVNVA